MTLREGLASEGACNRHQRRLLGKVGTPAYHAIPFPESVEQGAVRLVPSKDPSVAHVGADQNAWALLGPPLPPQNTTNYVQGTHNTLGATRV